MMVTRIRGVIAYSGLSIRAFAIKCGMSQPTLDKQLKGLRAISLDTVSNILNTYPEISAEWLMRGIGCMTQEVKDKSAGIVRINKLETQLKLR